jgi:16S rRNA (guanine1516-N2)-methyltransferase
MHNIMIDTALMVVCNQDSMRELSEALATPLGLVVKFNVDLKNIIEPTFAIVFDAQGVSLQQSGRQTPGPIRAEFCEGSVDHRRKFGGGKGQMIAKAVGVKAGVYPGVLDATAGLGKDAFVLATLGCNVQMLERSPCVHALLQNGLTRALSEAADIDPELAQIISRMQLMDVDSQNYLSNLSDTDRPDVIYLDPMFPDRQNSADVKKEMAAFHALVGKDEDADTLLEKSIAKAIYRVVVKRPRKAPFLAEKIPSYQLEGKSSRFDIYTNKKMPERLN